MATSCDKAPPARLARWIDEQSTPVGKIAQMMGCDRSYLWRVIHGKQLPSLRVAVRIERLTLTWDRGPIRVAEWVCDEAEAA